jgi:large subunit ribosomal protein L1
MVKSSKKYKENVQKRDSEKSYSSVDAVGLVKDMAYASFDESVDAYFRLGVDVRHADQQMRGTISLPKGVGKSVVVAVIATGDSADEATKAGADIVGADELLEKIKDGFVDFDVLISTPVMMKKVGVLGRVLGPRGLMPTPKTGTVTPKVGDAVAAYKAGKLEYRADKYGIIHLPIGRASFSADDLNENFTYLFDVLKKSKPAAAKGQYMRSISISSTMGPAVKVALESA